MNLKNYQNTDQLKKLSNNELHELSADVRKAIHEEVLQNGGHLGSNLAIVDLTLSLLKHFGSDVNYLFDTGYQSYAFKLLTTRPDILKNMHTPTGYSVFQEISEGDPYSGGHTSISSAWASGYNKVDKKTTIEIIGDGSLATSVGLGGMLNFASSSSAKGLFILNDNKQGIGINKFNYLDWNAIATGMGYAYFEVKNGHDYDELQKAWEFFEKSEKNVFVKVNTIKAYGVEIPNKDQALHYHVLPSKKSDFISPIKIITEHLSDFLKDKDSRVYCAGMIWAYGLQDLYKKFPDQIVDTGIAEEIAIIEAAAAANLGKKVYLYIASSFFQRVYDQLVHDVVRNHSNITIFITGASPSGIGDSHHGIYDLNMYNSFNEVKIFQPTTIGELKHLFKVVPKLEGIKIVRCEDGLLNNPDSGTIENWTFGLNPNAKKVLITYGTSYLNWEKYISENKLDLGLIKANSLNPLDEKLLAQLVKNNQQIFTYELVMQNNTLGTSIANHLHNVPVKTFAFKNTTIGRGQADHILKTNNLDLKTVADEIVSKY